MLIGSSAESVAPIASSARALVARAIRRAAREHLVEGERAGARRRAELHDGAQRGQALEGELAGHARGHVRRELAQHRQVVRRLEARGADQRPDAREVQRVFELARAVGGVDGDEDRADPGGGELGEQPLGPVRRPDPDPLAADDAEPSQAVGQRVDPRRELGVAPALDACRAALGREEEERRGMRRQTLGARREQARHGVARQRLVGRAGHGGEIVGGSAAHRCSGCSAHVDGQTPILNPLPAVRPAFGVRRPVPAARRARHRRRGGRGTGAGRRGQCCTCRDDPSRRHGSRRTMSTRSRPGPTRSMFHATRVPTER